MVRDNPEPSMEFCQRVAEELSNVSFNGVSTDPVANNRVAVDVQYDSDGTYSLVGETALVETDPDPNYPRQDNMERVYNQLDSKKSAEEVRQAILGLY